MFELGLRSAIEFQLFLQKKAGTLHRLDHPNA
jgi:hypothetical protein